MIFYQIFMSVVNAFKSPDAGALSAFLFGGNLWC